jgi:hypothetical protein
LKPWGFRELGFRPSNLVAISCCTVQHEMNWNLSNEYYFFHFQLSMHKNISFNLFTCVFCTLAKHFIKSVINYCFPIAHTWNYNELWFFNISYCNYSKLMWPHTMNFIIGKVNKGKSMQQCRIWKYFGILKIWRHVIGDEVD